MAKIKYTKNELKKQKDELKRFERFLPTLILKKQQLQIEIRRIQNIWEEKKKELTAIREQMDEWMAVYAENQDLHELIKIKAITIDTGNIAGVDIPIFKSIDFADIHFDLMMMPLWVDKGIEALKKTIALKKEIEIIARQIHKLGEELRVTTQRVNLFEKVKIPGARDNIKKIMIYIGDQQTAAVVCGKIAKKKLLRA